MNTKVTVAHWQRRGMDSEKCCSFTYLDLKTDLQIWYFLFFNYTDNEFFDGSPQAGILGMTFVAF